MTRIIIIKKNAGVNFYPAHLSVNTTNKSPTYFNNKYRCIISTQRMSVFQQIYQDSKHRQHGDQRCQMLTLSSTEFWTNQLRNQLAADTIQCCHCVLVCHQFFLSTECPVYWWRKVMTIHALCTYIVLLHQCWRLRYLQEAETGWRWEGVSRNVSIFSNQCSMLFREAAVTHTSEQLNIFSQSS